MLTHKVIDRNIADQLLARKRNGLTVYERLIPLFEAETPILIDEIVTHVNSASFDAFRSAAHKLKGSASVLGASELTELASAINLAGLNQELPDMALINALPGAFERFVSEARRLCGAEA